MDINFKKIHFSPRGNDGLGMIGLIFLLVGLAAPVALFLSLGSSGSDAIFNQRTKRNFHHEMLGRAVEVGIDCDATNQYAPSSPSLCYAGPTPSPEDPGPALTVYRHMRIPPASPYLIEEAGTLVNLGGAHGSFLLTANCRENTNPGGTIVVTVYSTDPSSGYKVPISKIKCPNY